ncbi:MAG: response regulator [Desulfobulbaceae bacterium]|nr:response regulator [Desulfobulbaceae bacterium]HIJ89405.1 response regulator [Deltaproteobacteria bacterium]
MLKKKILIVDDEPNNLQLLRQTLKDDYALAFAKNGKEALAAVDKHQPDLVLLDIMMPEMDGYETCQRLKNDPATAKIPVIFVTAMNELKDESRGFDVGAVDYITKPISPPIVQARVRIHLSLVRVDELEKTQRAAVYMLGDAGHYNDDNTGVHIWRMAAYSLALARGAGWSEERCNLIELASPMHDTGKIGIPDAILKKPAKLDADEWKIMMTHTTIGHGILSNGDTPLFKLAGEIALYHHEKWDGNGYPKGLAAEAIPESARIVAIADVFDALTMKRPYKEAWPLEDAISEIQRGSGSHFDPLLVQTFQSILPELITIKENWDAKE